MPPQCDLHFTSTGIPDLLHGLQPSPMDPVNPFSPLASPTNPNAGNDNDGKVGLLLDIEPLAYVCTENVAFSILDSGHSSRFVQRISMLLFRYWTLDSQTGLYGGCFFSFDI